MVGRGPSGVHVLNSAPFSHSVYIRRAEVHRLAVRARKWTPIIRVGPGQGRSYGEQENKLLEIRAPGPDHCAGQSTTDNGCQKRTLTLKYPQEIGVNHYK